MTKKKKYRSKHPPNSNLVNQLPNFNKKEIFNYVHKESVKVVNNYLKEVYSQLPDLENARRSLDIDLDIPMLDTPNDADRLNMYNLMQDRHKMHEKMPKLLDKIFKDEPEIRERLPDLLKYQKLSKSLYEDLKKDNLRDAVLENQKNDELRTHLWSTTIINMSNHLTFNPQKLVEVIDGNKLGISWPILVYSYIRDFELFFRFVVDPIIGYDPLNTIDKKNYVERFREFCETPEKMRFYSETLKLVLKSSVRSRLAHQQYYVKVSTQEIILFKDDNFPQGRDKVIKFNELLELTAKLNSLLWSALILVINKMDDTSDDKIREIQQITYSSDFPEILSELQNELQLLPKFNLSILKSFLKDYCEKHPHSSTYLPDPIIESFNYHLLVYKGIEPNLRELMEIQARSQYLVAYALLEEKYLKPIAKAIKPQIHLGYVKDGDLLDIVKNYKSSKYEELFRVFNPKVRNAIAHVDYYMKNTFSHFLDKETQSLKPLGIDFLDAFKVFSDLDDVFNISKEEVALLMGISKFLNNVYFDGGNKNSVEYQIAGETILGLDPTEYKVLYTFGVVCILIGSLLTGSRKEIRKSVKEVNQIIKNYNQDPTIIYASIVFFAFKNDKPDQSIKWMRNLINSFSIQPKKNCDKQLLWLIKSLIHQLNNNIKKARESYNQALILF